MALKVFSRFPAGNATGIRILPGGDLPEIHFSSDPCGAPEALWFYLRIEETEPDPARHTKVRLVWNHIDTIAGMPADPPICIPVGQNPGHTWSRLKQGEVIRGEDGQRSLTWLIPHPAPGYEVAWCFPYGPAEAEQLVSRSRDYWRADPIGIATGGKPLVRVANGFGSLGSHAPGFYFLARQHAADTPGTWVLDGLLRHWGQTRKGNHLIWAVPLADPDGIARGHTGYDAPPADPDHSWEPLPLRHEVRLLQTDLARWAARCRPALLLDFQAAGPADTAGVHAVGAITPDAPTAAEETKWANVIRNELQNDYAAADFLRPAGRPSRHPGRDACAHARAAHDTPALRLVIPWAMAGTTVLAQKHYREIGQRIAAALLKRKG